MAKPPGNGLQVVWFKRDLRVRDHRPLVEAARRGPVVCLHVFEPELWSTPEYEESHFRFVRESLEELDRALRERGGQLSIRVGSVVKVLADIHRSHGIAGLWSHEETGSDLTYRRDLAVAGWAREQGVPWQEFPQTGVIRRLGSRNGWSRRWQGRMSEAVLEAPDSIPTIRSFDHGTMPDARDLGVASTSKEGLQGGGESAAHDTLHSFLTQRGAGYRKEMSSPLTGEWSCSRLSAYLAWGNISVREAYRECRMRSGELRAMRDDGQIIDKLWLQSLSSFEGRLRWHCHFMQKLEDEPEIEFENMNRAFDGLRESEFDEARFEAWCRAETGYPMVDACMRYVQRTGWLNFRMRAMLVSFAAYHLWLHWRRPAVFLARHFLDFEPGIHFSQFQMQSGVTGINTLRIYSPAKQLADQDPEGIFVRRELPELERVPLAYLAEPHRMPDNVQRHLGCVIGRDYPAPVVDHRAAYAEARRRMGEFRKLPEVRDASAAVQEKHGSRKRPARRP